MRQPDQERQPDRPQDRTGNLACRSTGLEACTHREDEGDAMKAWIVWGAILPGILMGGIVLARAQAAAQVSAPPPAGAPPVSSPASPRTRDPFRTVLVKKEAPTASAGPICTQPGKKSLLIGQLLIQGIARSVDGQWIAVVDNKTKRSYFLRAKDEVCNGVVTRVTEESVAFEERSTDAFGRPRTREVIKRLAGE